MEEMEISENIVRGWDKMEFWWGTKFEQTIKEFHDQRLSSIPFSTIEYIGKWLFAYWLHHKMDQFESGIENQKSVDDFYTFLFKAGEEELDENRRELLFQKFRDAAPLLLYILTKAAKDKQPGYSKLPTDEERKVAKIVWNELKELKKTELFDKEEWDQHISRLKLRAIAKGYNILSTLLYALSFCQIDLLELENSSNEIKKQEEDRFEYWQSHRIVTRYRQLDLEMLMIYFTVTEIDSAVTLYHHKIRKDKSKPRITGKDKITVDFLLEFDIKIKGNIKDASRASENYRNLYEAMKDIGPDTYVIYTPPEKIISLAEFKYLADLKTHPLYHPLYDEFITEWRHRTGGAKLHFCHRFYPNKKVN
jgi:hypothetical protein